MFGELEKLSCQIDNEIHDICLILMNADAVDYDLDFCEETSSSGKITYSIPNEYNLTVDYHKLARAIYNAGYRKGRPS